MSQRLQLTVVLEPIANPSGAGAVPQRPEPPPVASTAVSMPVPAAPEPRPRRVWPWVALSLASMAAAAGITAAVLLVDRDVGEDAAASVQPARAEERDRASLEPGAPSSPEPLRPATEPEPLPSRAGVAWAREAAPEPAEELADEPIVATPEPEPRPRRPRAVEPKPKTDQQVVAALKAKIISKCKDSGDTMVRIEGVISSAGTIASPLITPSTGPGACAKKLVLTAKFDPAGGVRPMPRFSVAL